jgi:GGDEF-like domain/PucR C-terminal helix-turn-helix domain
VSERGSGGTGRGAPAGATVDTGCVVTLLAAAAGTGRQPGRADLDACRRLGADAGSAGVPVAEVTAAVLAAAERAFARLPGVADAATANAARAAGRAVLAALHRALAAVLDGYEDAQRAAARQADDSRRRFVDDLLYGRGDPVRLAEAAQRFGVLLAGRHVVAVVRADRPFTDADAVAGQLERALVQRFGHHNALVASKEGLLVCVLPSTLRGAAGELAHQLVGVLGTPTGWQIGVGRPQSGPGGVVRSFEEARNALHLADRLGFRAPVLHAADLLVFPVLLRDQEAITDLVRAVLGPLAQARGGARPMIDTLAAFFDSQGNTTAAARRLNVSVRAVSYRLDRVKALTGYTPTEPTQRFTLEAAVLGARLLDWPATPLPDAGPP